MKRELLAGARWGEKNLKKTLRHVPCDSRTKAIDEEYTILEELLMSKKVYPGLKSGTGVSEANGPVSGTP